MPDLTTTYLINGYRGAISNWFRKYTLQLDPLKNTYIEKRVWFWVVRLSTKKTLPPIKYVLVFRQLFVKCEPCDTGEFEDDGLTWYQISLVHGHYRRIIVHETRNRKEAFAKANELGLLLGKKVLDSASNRRLSQWIQPTADQLPQ